MSQPTQYLFTPPNGNSYNDDDWKILCKATPIPFDQLPPYLHYDCEVPGYVRPVLVCCWLEGEEKLEKLLRERFPHCASFAYDDPDDEEPIEDVSDSIIEMKIAMLNQFDIPQYIEERFTIISAISPDGEVTLSLAVGDNRRGLIPIDIIRTLADEYFDGRMPAWYIMRRGWKWETKAKFDRTKRGHGHQRVVNKQPEAVA